MKDDSFEKFLDKKKNEGRKKRPAGRGGGSGGVQITGTATIVEPQRPPVEAPVAPRSSGSNTLSSLLDQARQGGPAYNPTREKKKENDQQPRNNPPPPARSTIPAALQDPETLRKLKNGLRQPENHRNHSNNGHRNKDEYDPSKPLLPKKPAQTAFTSKVSWCKHYDFEIDWNLSDSSNRCGSWDSRMRNKSRHASDLEDHKDCVQVDTEERSKTMTTLILKEMNDPRKGTDNRLPALSAVRREVSALMLGWCRKEKTVEKPKDYSKFVNTKGVIVQNNPLGRFKTGDHGFSESAGTSRVTKEPKKPRHTNDAEEARKHTLLVTKKPRTLAPEKPKPKPKPQPQPKPQSESLQMTNEERKLMGKIKHTGETDPDSANNPEIPRRKKRKASESETGESESEETIYRKQKAEEEYQEQKIEWEQMMNELAAKKAVDKDAKKSPKDVSAAGTKKRKTSASSATSHKSDASDGLTEAINSEIHAQSNPEPVKKVKVRDLMIRDYNDDSSDEAPPPPRIRYKTVLVPKRKVSATEDANDKAVPSRKRIRTESKSAPVATVDDEDLPKTPKTPPPVRKGRKNDKFTDLLTTSDEEAGDEITIVGGSTPQASTSSPSSGQYMTQVREEITEALVEDATTVTESVKVTIEDETLASSRAKAITATRKLTKVTTETVESTNTVTASKRKLDDSTIVDDTATSQKKAKLTLDTSEATIHPPPPMTLAQQEDEEAVSPRSQPRNTPPRQPESTTPLSSSELMGSRKRKSSTEVDDEEVASPSKKVEVVPDVESTTPLESPKTPRSPPSTPAASPELTLSKKRKSTTDNEETIESPSNAPRKKVRFSPSAGSPEKRKMSIEYITATKDETTQDAAQSEVLISTSASTTEARTQSSTEPETIDFDTSDADFDLFNDSDALSETRYDPIQEEGEKGATTPDAGQEGERETADASDSDDSLFNE